MFKKSVSLLASGIFAASILTGCGNTNTSFATLPQTQLQQPQQVQTQSFTGVMKEISKVNKDEFKKLDANKDKAITPDEYGVDTPDQLKAFYAIDKNKDGKVVEKEWMPGLFEKVGLTLRLRKTARALFQQLDKSRDGYLTDQELNNGLISTQYNELFKQFDKEKKGWLFNRGTQNKLSKSEFENLFAHIAMKNMPNTGSSAPVPSEPAPPADAPPAI